MTQSISVRREGDLIVIEDRERTPDHIGVLSSTFLLADDAILLGNALLSAGWAIKEDAVMHRVVPLATASDPYPEDRR
jgi:hypothetical protein